VQALHQRPQAQQQALPFQQALAEAYRLSPFELPLAIQKSSRGKREK
jgi:hypothetical protein